jgi:murein L,D-transpeptidase YcbB/YkuD
MKLSPTVTLAVALAAGVAGAAVAQTSMTPSSSTTDQQQQQLQQQQQQQQSTQSTAPTNPQSTQTTQPGAPTYSQATPNYGKAGTANPTATQSSFRQPQNSNDQVRQAQQQLRAAGLYNGPQDGLMDPDTMAAIARFQQQRGLKQTSTLDQPTMAALMGAGTTGSGSGQGPTSAPAGAGGNAGGAPPAR